MARGGGAFRMAVPLGSTPLVVQAPMEVAPDLDPHRVLDTPDPDEQAAYDAALAAAADALNVEPDEVWADENGEPREGAAAAFRTAASALP